MSRKKLSILSLEYAFLSNIYTGMMPNCNLSSLYTPNSFPTFLFQSRAALSLLGYCYYQMQDFVNAADCYEQLTVLNPEVEDYKLYYAQSLYKASLFDEAMKVSCQLDNPEYAARVRWKKYCT